MQIHPPEQKDTPDAPKQAEARLKEMGPMTTPQKIMGATLLGAVLLWVLGDVVGISAVVTAMMGLSVLLLTGVLKWQDCLAYNPAWDTLTWFAILIGMSNAMNDMGIIKFFADQIGAQLTAMNLGWPWLFLLLHIVFFYIHYFFASQTAHVGALFAAFLALMLKAGIPPMLAMLSLSFNVRSPASLLFFASSQLRHVGVTDGAQLRLERAHPCWWGIGLGFLSILLGVSSVYWCAL